MPNRLFSIGLLATRIQAHPADILATAERLGIEPSLHLDEVPYFVRDDADEITVAILEARTEARRNG